MKYKIRLINGPCDGEVLELERAYSDPKYFPLTLYFPVFPLLSNLAIETASVAFKPIRKHAYKAINKFEYYYIGEK